MPIMPQPIVALVEDLVFTAKLRAAAQAAGVSLQTTTQVEEFLPLVRAAAPGLILVDLNFSRADALQVVARVRELANGKKTPIVGFLSHVQMERAQQALNAGCTVALPRSLFVQQLPTLLRDGIAALSVPDAPAGAIVEPPPAPAVP